MIPEGDDRTELFNSFLEHGADLSANIENDLESEQGSYLFHSVSEYLEDHLPDSAECYNIFLEHKRKIELKNLWNKMKRLSSPLYVLRYITGVEGEVLTAFVLNMVFIGLEILQNSN